MSTEFNAGDEITFKYEGNITATLEEVKDEGGGTWLKASSLLSFEVPASQVATCESAEGEA
ncbi:MAG TPA: hypothetical protein VGB17_02915 [Pyrinomonadaceae bacterium]|jgi:hypothetical protein